MLATSARIIAVVTIIVMTIAYLFSLGVLTLAACFWKSAGCTEGWTARTIATLVYLGLIGATIYGSRWLIRMIEQRAAGRRDGIM